LPAPSPSPRATAAPRSSTSPDDAPPTDAGSPSPAATDQSRLTDADLAALGVNELGRVLVAEWHVIGDTDGEYRTSRDTFRSQLQELYDRGYRPVTQTEFIEGTFPIPAGTSPVLLTFDDSTRGQLALGDDGEPTPESAVGILEEFAAQHPGWRRTAVFGFNFPEPFGDPGYAPKLQWLADNGYEFSNHSVGHTDLTMLSNSELVANLAENQARLHEAVPGAPLPSLTLPFGKMPQDRDAAASGTAPDGTSYEHRLIYLVGSDPARSPHHTDFDPLAIQRVPAHAVVGTGPEWFGDWLDRLDAERLRFVSDGRADTVTYPADQAEVADVAPGLRARTYGSP
jgi:peptidoglycan/xylan/chitin deacetylase (PgdA/CDA1 family)